MTDILYILAYYFLIYLGLKFCYLFTIYLYSHLMFSPINVKKLGQWALITGSTDGIGRAYAEALAKKGLDIILVSRSPFKLQNVAADIEKKFKVRTKIIRVDFSNSPSEYLPELKSSLAGLEIGVLVNNVGVSYDHPEQFLSLPDDKISKLVNTNILSLNTMIELVLPAMVERKKGVVINVSSLSGMFTTPLLSAYSATKSYVDFLTRGLEFEYRNKGICMQVVLPSFVVSKMSKIRKPSFIAPTPEVFVKSALGKLGVETRTTGYWSHELLAWIMNWIPEEILVRLVHGNLSVTRAKALKKKAH